MKHFYDYYGNVSKQAFDTAVITNSKGRKMGKIVVRYTDSQIGYNNQTGIIFYSDEEHKLDFGTTLKGSTYNQDNVYNLLKSIGAKVYGFGNKRFYTYGEKLPEAQNTNFQNTDSISRCTEFEYFKIGKNKYHILWV